MNSFFVDECLSPVLVAVANERGFAATHVVFLDRDGTDDWIIAQLVLRRNDILVTNNAGDFLGLYARFEVHPGLIIILPNVEREEQIRLFEIALKVVEEREDIVNHVLEVDRDGSTRIIPWSALDLPK